MFLYVAVNQCCVQNLFCFLSKPDLHSGFGKNVAAHKTNDINLPPVHLEVLVFYIDTKNDFCAERLLEIFHQGGRSNNGDFQTSGPPNLSCLKRIQVAKAFDGEALCDALR